MTNQELRNERDMLNGNLNRMMITDDFAELRSMYAFARDRLENIYNARMARFEEEELFKEGKYDYT